MLVDARDVFFLGRNINYPTMLEGALKLKEISYIHAEGYAAGEMKHGPLALLDASTPVVARWSGTDLREDAGQHIRGRGQGRAGSGDRLRRATPTWPGGAQGALRPGRSRPSSRRSPSRCSCSSSPTTPPRRRDAPSTSRRTWPRASPSTDQSSRSGHISLREQEWHLPGRSWLRCTSPLLISRRISVSLPNSMDRSSASNSISCSMSP